MKIAGMQKDCDALGQEMTALPARHRSNQKQDCPLVCSFIAVALDTSVLMEGGKWIESPFYKKTPGTLRRHCPWML